MRTDQLGPHFARNTLAGGRRYLAIPASLGIASTLTLLCACATGERLAASDRERGSGAEGGHGASPPGSAGTAGAAFGSGGSSVGSGGAYGTGGAGEAGTGTGGTTGDGGTGTAGNASAGTGAAGGGTALDGGSAGSGGAAPDGSIVNVGEFPYLPTNFDPVGLDPGSVAATTQIDCGISTFDSSTGTFDNWCGQSPPSPVTRPQAGGPDIVILPLRDLVIAQGSTLRLTGASPVVLTVFGNGTIAGIVDASADGMVPGAGGNWSCDTSKGGDGNGSPARYEGASGGGGGGFGTAGGSSGNADTDDSDGENAAAPGGVPRGDVTLTPLMGGCAGGQAGGCATAGGAGGGAIQISASGSLTLTGTVRVNGGDGSLPCGASDEGGGTGGGSGGGVLLEATTLSSDSGVIEANGGAGGPDGSFFHCGGTSGGAGSTSPSQPGGNGVNCVAGSPGGGGGYGRISAVSR